MMPSLTARYNLTRGLWSLLITALMLAGCAGTPPTTHHYTLPEHPAAAVTTSPDTTAGITVMPVQLAGHLLVNGLVLQISPLELQEARNHVWADTLANQIDRSLAQALRTRLQHTRLIPPNVADTPVLNAVVIIDQFQSRYDHNAVVSGQYRLMDAERRLVTQQSFSYTVPLAHDGYPALVGAMDNGLLQLAEALARDIDQHAR